MSPHFALRVRSVGGAGAAESTAGCSHAGDTGDCSANGWPDRLCLFLQCNSILNIRTRSNKLRPLWYAILALTLSVSSSAEPTHSQRDLTSTAHRTSQRLVIGSVADVAFRYENGQPITVIHILEFKSDPFPQEPKYLQVRLCGNQYDRFKPVVHTDISLVYNPISQTKMTGCLPFISSESWHDNSKWQTITFTLGLTIKHPKRSAHLDKYIKGTINGATTK